MKNLILHIGHIKTGSTAIQNAIVPLRKDLLSRGIAYPITHGTIRSYRHKKIQSGNGYLLKSHLAKPMNREYNSHLFSSELLLHELQSDKLKTSLLDFRARHDLNFEMVCYTRDFFKLSFSTWHQYIKRGLGTKRYVDFMLDEKHRNRHKFYTEAHKGLLSIFKWAARENIPLRVFNYDRYKSDIVAHFLSTVIPDSETLLSKVPNRHQQINRSLTFTECEIQRAFNKHYPIESASFISDRFVEEEPNLKKYIPPITWEDYEKILEVHGPMVSLLNQHLDPNERILIENHQELDKSASPSDTNLAITMKQMETLARGISSELMRLSKKSGRKNTKLLDGVDSILQKAGLTLVRRVPFIKRCTP